jgi:type IX secretion system PorP/SprF family membrane protein
MHSIYQLLFLFIISLPVVKAQDPYFSQFFANRVYLNPAYAGFDPGTTITVNFREQWFGIPDGVPTAANHSYRTYNVAADIQLPCLLDLEDANLGIALIASRDEAGQAPLITSSFGLAFSHEQALIRKPGKSRWQRLDLRAGLQLSMHEKRIQDDYFIYSGQLDPVVGLITEPAALSLSTSLFPNFNAGIMLRGFHNRSKYSNTLFTLGLTLANVNRPDQSLREVTAPARLPMRTTFHAGFTHRLTRFSGVKSPVYIAPQFRWDSQLGVLNTQTIGAYSFAKGFYTGLFFQYNFPNNPPVNPGINGNSFLRRNTTALILNAGIDVRSALDWGVPWRKRESGILLGFTYDLNLAGLTHNNTFGVLEFSLRINLAGKKQRDCAATGKFELYRGDCPVRF